MSSSIGRNGRQNLHGLSDKSARSAFPISFSGRCNPNVLVSRMCPSSALF